MHTIMSFFNHPKCGKVAFVCFLSGALVCLFLLVSCETSNNETQAPQITPDIPLDVRDEIAKLRSPDPCVRAVGAARLRKMGNRSIQAIPFLVELLGDETEVSVKRGSFRVISVSTTPGKEAALALSALGRAAVEPVIEKLKDSDPDARENAAWTLGIIGDPRAVQPLEETLKDTDRRVRRVAEWALKRIEKGGHPRKPAEKQLI